jgi:hypothetical protein
MVAHASLTGADLHEPKGVASASADTVYVANGAGSGTWEKISADSIDSTSVKNVNKFQYLYRFEDIGTVKSVYLPIKNACTLTSVTVISQSTPTTASTVLTFKNNGSSTIGTVTVTTAAAPATFTMSSPVNTALSANTYLQIDTDGGAANTPDVMILIEFTLT